MAFARIISHSHQYAQQLALDLLARGYAVEIVSPDAVPDTPADLELRVEAGGSEAQGRVTEIREGKQVRSIAYLQRLKPMMADLLRKWPAHEKPAQETDTPKENPAFSFNAEPEYSDMELPSNKDQQMSEPAPEASAPDFEGARLISPAADSKSEAAFSITGEPMLWAESDPERADGSEVWFWRAAVGFAAVALVILVFGMALRRNPAAPAASVAIPASNHTAFAVQPAESKATALAPNASITPLPVKPAVIAAATSSLPSMVRVKPSAAIRRVKGSQFQEVVNGDTTVTYFNAKPEPSKTAAKQESGIKHYSDLN